MNQTQVTERPVTPNERLAASWVTPRADICEVEEAYLLKLEMPGVSKEGLEITVENNELTVVGRRCDPKVQGEIIYRETRLVDFRRVFDLDPLIDISKIGASICQGIVTVTLPKAESLKPVKIVVSD